MLGFDSIFAEVTDAHGCVTFRDVCECDFNERDWDRFLAGASVSFDEWCDDPWALNGGTVHTFTAVRADDPLDQVERHIPLADAETELALAAWREESVAW